MTPAHNLPDRLDRDRCLLVVIDIQERFRDVIHRLDMVLAGTDRLVRFWQALGLPVIVTEHYPRGLGHTVPEVKDAVTPWAPLEKIHFSCAGDEGFMAAVRTAGRDQVVLCGIETHVCVYQTAFDLLRDGRQVAVATDAVSSCLPEDREAGLGRMRDLGVQLMSTQMIMFEILGRAGTADFKAVAPILKS